ncbi:MAG: helix-turn-helix domain-containing protein [Prevotellaceae bacterium]|nr:helix-turn-helix domain-containing protein [Prevotellaceae bacterium]
MGELKDTLRRIETLLEMRVKTVLNTEEAALLLGIKPNTLRHLVCERRVPHYKQGAKTWFRRGELEAWMTRHRVKTDEEVTEEAATRCALRRDGRTRA